MLILSAIIGMILLVAVLAPFFSGAGGILQSGSAVVSAEQLERQKQALLLRYIEDEKSFKDGELNAREWKARQSFILGRYIDAARRIDYLSFVKKSLVPLLFITMVGSAVLGASSRALAAVSPFLGERHLLMLRPGVDAVWGTSVFAVVNEGPEPLSGKFNVMLPKETVDFAAQEGVTPEELKQNEDGTLYVEKLFPPGTTVIGIGFMINGSAGSTAMTFIGPPGDSRFVAVLSSKGVLGLKSEGLKPDGSEDSLPSTGYDQYIMKEPLAPGAEFKIAVTGIPEGRKNFWILGGTVAGLIFSLSGALAWRKRPIIGSNA